MKSVFSLNFSSEKEKVLKVLKEFEELKTCTEYEEFRCKAGDSNITLFKSGKLLIQGKDAEEVKDLLFEKLDLKEDLVLGIDEVGRGESFGSMVVGGVLADRNKLRELRDSKKIRNLNEKYGLVKKNAVKIKTVSFTAEEIDNARGGGKTLNTLLADAMNEIISDFPDVKARIDGSPLKGVSKAEFIVKGDDSDPVIGAASIVAKHARENSSDKAKRKSWNLKQNS